MNYDVFPANADYLLHKIYLQFLPTCFGPRGHHQGNTSQKLNREIKLIEKIYQTVASFSQRIFTKIGKSGSIMSMYGLETCDRHPHKSDLKQNPSYGDKTVFKTLLFKQMAV
jgi:hypothetical protein